MLDNFNTSSKAELRTSRKAIAAFVLGILGLFLWILGAVPAIVFALLAKADIRRDGLLRGRVLATLGLVLGVLGLVVSPILAGAVLMHGPSAGKPRVAHFHLGGILNDSPAQDPAGTFMGQPSTLHALLKRVQDAKDDPAVKAAIITVNGLQVHLIEMEELRAALVDFTSSGKKLFAHCEEAMISLPLFATLGSASRLSIAPVTWLDLKGLYGESLYLKDGLAKIGVEADVVHVGEYKAAGEMLARAEPSDAAKENMNWLFDGLYQSCLSIVAESRHKTVDEAKALIDSGLFTADQVLNEGFVDAVEYQDDLVEQVKREYGPETFIDNDYHKQPALDVDMAHPFQSCLNLAQHFAQVERPEPGDSIGLIYVDGMIVTGYGPPSVGAYSGDLRAAFKEAMNDDSIKAVVLRVNSPGGSATASEAIYRAEQLLQKRKPLIVSMGGVAASGGYYVSCSANQVFADETTVTGSIGVISSKLVSVELWKKLGINWFPYQRGANADMFSSQHPYTEQQRGRLAAASEAAYKTFKEHVEAGRGKKLTKKLDDMAGGRVFTGKQALELGLVDKIGGLEAAIAFAAQSVSLDKYKVRVVPESKDAVSLLVAALLGEAEKPHSDLATNAHTGPGSLGSLLAGTSAETRGIAALLEGLDRPHADAVVEMLCRLHLVHQEGLAMVMPQVLVFQ